MNSLIHADVFFFITAIAVGVLTIVLCVIGWYVFMIVRDVKYVSKRLRDGIDELEDDFMSIRNMLTQEGQRAKYLVEFFLNRFTSKKKSAPRPSSRKKPDISDTIE